MSRMNKNAVDRRMMLAAGLAGGMTLAVPGRVSAQGRATANDAPSADKPLLTAHPRPVVDARFPHEIAPGLFILPDARIPLVPNIGIVVGRDTVLVIDCGIGPASGAAVLECAKRLAPGRRVVLTLTHAHPEHGFGAQAFKRSARIWYNRSQADYLARAGQTMIDGFRSVVLPPDQRSVLDGVQVTPPDDAYSGERASLDLGGRVVEFRSFGTAHSPGDQIVHIPDVGVVFVGDLIEERMFPIVPYFPPMITASDIDPDRWDDALRTIAALTPKIIVPGHGNLGGAEVADHVRQYLHEARAMAAAGASPEQVRTRHPTWENPEYIAPALAYFRAKP